MSKINATQAEALKSSSEKPETTSTTPAKAVATKTAPEKPASKAAVKPAPAKPTVTKPAAEKATPVNKTPIKAAVIDTKKTEKPKTVKEKTPKLKMERDSFTMPKTEYAQFSVLKDRLTKLGQPAKKSELLRAGIMQLSAMTDAALKAAMSKVPAIKTGRPKKK
jgi:hypothetical protein